MAAEFDVLDYEKQLRPRPWVMYYADGRFRAARLRWDLIGNFDKTRVTQDAKTAWGPDCPFGVYETELINEKGNIKK